jgi:hypothetical protein
LPPPFKASFTAALGENSSSSTAATAEGCRLELWDHSTFGSGSQLLQGRVDILCQDHPHVPKEPLQGKHSEQPTLIKICKEIQNGAVAKSYMTNGLLMYREIFAHFLIY